jgi:hypothetical protein
VRRFTVISTLPLFLAACQGTHSVPTSSGAQTALSSSVRAALPIAAASDRTPAERATFSKPNVAEGKGPPSVTWIFASNGEGGNVDVYNAATLAMISQCVCTGVGLAVDPASGDLAVGSRSATVTVWHVKSKRITQFATLNLSQGPYAIGLAYDEKGDLYAANAGDNIIDFFASREIMAGGGIPTRTLVTSNLNGAYYLAATGNKLLADGYDRYGQPILVSVNRSTGADVILQRIQGQLAEGIAFDRRQNLILNNPGNTNMLLVFKKPWTGSPTTTFVYGSGAENSYYTGISLNKVQDTLWAGNFSLQNVSHGFTNVQANSYPLGSVGGATSPIANEFYDSIAVDPQAKT